MWSRRDKFEVKREAHSHPTGSQEPGKALVYVFGDSELDNTAIRIGALNTRVGVDGEWVGAYGSKSYMYFSVAPGEHRLCTSQQSSIKSRRANTASATTFTAVEGKVYYFRTSVEERTNYPPGVRIEAVDPAEGQLLVGASALSSSHPKK